MPINSWSILHSCPHSPLLRWGLWLRSLVSCSVTQLWGFLVPLLQATPIGEANLPWEGGSRVSFQPWLHMVPYVLGPWYWTGFELWLLPTCEFHIRKSGALYNPWALAGTISISQLDFNHVDSVKRGHQCFKSFPSKDSWFPNNFLLDEWQVKLWEADLHPPAKFLFYSVLRWLVYPHPRKCNFIDRYLPSDSSRACQGKLLCPLS